MAHPIAVNDSDRRVGGIPLRRLRRSRPGYLRSTGARVARARATDRSATVGRMTGAGEQQDDVEDDAVLDASDTLDGVPSRIRSTWALRSRPVVRR